MIAYPEDEIDGIRGLTIEEKNVNPTYHNYGGRAIYGGVEILEFRVTVYHPNTSRSHSFVELKFTDNVNSWIDNMPSNLYMAQNYT